MRTALRWGPDTYVGVLLVDYLRTGTDQEPEVGGEGGREISLRTVGVQNLDGASG